MTREELIASQVAERADCLRKILSSTSTKKMIVAGPGAGKTFTFSKLFEQPIGGPKLAMTFIRKLTEDMQESFGGSVEVKTFHAFCKKHLHEIYGKYDIRPHLSPVIRKDAELLGNGLFDFDHKFERLEEGAETAFYIRQGDYYDVSGFNDSVYRLLVYVRGTPGYLGNFGHIVVDEYQDFNKLEVEFLNALESKGPILIVGDDDQAVYGNRNSTARYLREKHSSGNYEIFSLPFCSRCPKPIVEATNALIAQAKVSGLLQERITKRFDYFLNDKEADSQKYPTISFAQCSNAKVIAQYIRKEIGTIPADEITESHTKKFPTVLIVGPKQYLNIVAQDLKDNSVAYEYQSRDEIKYTLVDGYRDLIEDIESNFGWRIVAEFLGGNTLAKQVAEGAVSGRAASDIVGATFKQTNGRIIEILKKVKGGESLTSQEGNDLHVGLGDYFDEVVLQFAPPEEDEGVAETDESKPSILLKSYVGSKGLSAGHVFVLGMNNGEMPCDPNAITDIEVCQFLVALTRTRKKCHLLSNKWLLNPKDKNGFIPANTISRLISWLPADLLDNKGSIKAADLKGKR